MQIVITPQISIPLEQPSAPQPQASQLSQLDVPMVWAQDGANFRLDITLPDLCELNILFPKNIDSLHINGRTIWEKSNGVSDDIPGMHTRMSAAGLQLNCTVSGPLHILAPFSPKSETKRSTGRNRTN